MDKYSFDVVKKGKSCFIKLGSEFSTLLNSFLTCLSNEEVIHLKYLIESCDSHFSINDKDTIDFIVLIALKVNEKLKLNIQTSETNLPINKEAYLFISSSKNSHDEVIFTFRKSIYELLQTFKLIESNDIEVLTKVDNEDEINLLIAQKDDIEDKNKIYENLLDKINSNQDLIENIQNKIKTLNQQLATAKSTEKLHIYQEHAKLTQELNRLNEENDHFEYKGNLKEVDSTSVKVIAKHYKEQLSEINLELKDNIKNRLLKSHLTNPIYISSSYVENDNVCFMINNIIKHNSKSKYESFYAVLHNLLLRGDYIFPSDSLMDYSFDKLKNIYKFQLTTLSLIRYGYLDDDEWKFKIEDVDKEYFEIACNQILIWVQKICILAQIDYKLPKLQLSDPEGIHISLIDDNSNTKIITVVDNPKTSITTSLWIANIIKYKLNKFNKKQISILEELLKWVFNFSAFRDGQIPIIINYLNGNNTLGILPTGAGKSLTYYFCVLMQPKISLIIAPLNSLIIDQIDKLYLVHKVNRITNLTSSSKNFREDMIQLSKGITIFNFTSPERAQSNQFREVLIKLNHTETIGSIILDEVHCLSEWGHDFRVPYLMLSETLNIYTKGIRYLGLTATASVNVVRDLMVELSIEEKDVITTEHMSRKNLEFEIKSFSNIYDAQNEMSSIIVENFNKGNSLDFNNQNKNVNSVLIFSQAKKQLQTSVDVLFNIISTNLQIFGDDKPKLVAKYTGDYKDEQQDFMSNKKTIMVATKAFGMGIDKSNIRMTIHFGMPASRESFYQEAGRAGRDGNKSFCKLFAIRPYDNRIDSLVREFLNPNTNIERMNEIMKYLSQRKVDIATTFYFFLDGYEIPIIETDHTMSLYKQLVLNETKYIKLSNQTKKKTEKYLYILYKLGIVKSWNVSYLFNGSELSTNVDFDVELDYRFNDINHIKKNVLNYINAYMNNDESNIIEAEKIFTKKIDEVSSLDQLNQIIFTMREWYHSLFIMTRREQISNMYQMIIDYGNSGPTMEIQNVIDKFFNITEIIGLSQEGYDLLTFDGVSLSDVVRYAFELKKNSLTNRKYEMQVALQSNVNIKNSLYASLIHLRLDEFVDNNNGDQRLIYVLSQLNESERDSVINSCTLNYKNLDDNQKINLIKILETYDQLLIHKLYEENERDLIINEYVMRYLNNKFDESWK